MHDMPKMWRLCGGLLSLAREASSDRSLVGLYDLRIAVSSAHLSWRLYDTAG